MKRLLIFPLLFLCAAYGFSLTTNWTGTASDGNWSNPANWDNGVPGINDEAVFDGIDATITSATGTPQISRLLVKGGGARFLSLQINLDITGGAIDDRSVQVNAGQLYFEAGYTFNISAFSGQDGIFTNNANAQVFINGDVNITVVNDDGILVNSGGSVTNNGNLTIDGGANDQRLLLVNSGSLTNNGILTLTGGKQFSRVQVNLDGAITNGPGGVLDVENGRIKVNNDAMGSGVFMNNGLFISSLATPLRTDIATTEVVNNGFYRYGNNPQTFSDDGTNPTGTDNGIDLNDLNDTQIDAGMSCLVDLADQPYTWTDGDSFTATAAANGELDLTTADFPADPVMLTTTIQGTDITLEISNFCAAALPIELLTFSGTPMANSVMLKWQTATEVNNDFMAVERSIDARSFTEIGRLAGAGNSNTILPYELEDKQPNKGINYYRLRQVDTDGSTTFSNVIAVRYSGQNNNEEPLIYPTLVRSGGTLYLDLRNDQSAQNRIWTVRNTHGQEMISFPLVNNGITELSLPGLPAGLYLLTSTAGLKTTTLKFLVTD